jgi:hypothetical protein
MRAQGYDEAANMSDIHRSVQSSIRERERESNSAIYFAISGLQSYVAHCCSDYIKVTEHLLRFDRDLSECQTLIRHFETKKCH